MLGTEGPGIRFQKGLKQRAGSLRSGWGSQVGGSRSRNPGGGRAGALGESCMEHLQKASEAAMERAGWGQGSPGAERNLGGEVYQETSSVRLSIGKVLEHQAWG